MAAGTSPGLGTPETGLVWGLLWGATAWAARPAVKLSVPAPRLTS